jgi:hypothetical protein
MKGRDDLLALFRQRNLLLTVPIFVVGVFRTATLNVLLQYTSIRFDWTLARAALFISEVAAVNVVIFLLFLPRLIAWLQNKKRILPQVIDLWVLRCSLFLLLLGAILIGIAPNIPTLITGKHDMHVHYLANYPRSCTGLCHRFWMPYLDTCTCDLMGA